MSKMTDKQIIKALGFCKDNGILAENCEKCAYYKYGALCMDTMFENVLDLINRQQAEIEKLNVELVGMRGACNSYKMHYDNAKAEIERLQKLLDGKCDRCIAKDRADAIKEFAERLKVNHISKDDKGKLHLLVEYNEFDNLVKEMVGDDNA